jgi:predicted RNA-binding protein with PUA-like domain
MQYWLMKSEPGELSIDDLKSLPNSQVEWFGVRNYQARNFMRDDMKPGDLALFWHSSCKEPGIYGIVKIITKAHPDSTQFKIDSEYYDPKSTEANPRWWCVDVQLQQKTKYISINKLREDPKLADLQVLQKGNRLSVTPISSKHWQILSKLLNI